METIDELKHIYDTLEDPELKETGLIIEVLWSALKFAQQTPNATIAECIAFGYNEWMK